MFCNQCGNQIDDNAAVCPACGAPQTPQSSVPPPQLPVVPNHLVGAILTTLFCCLPFGIVSIVYASSVNSKVAAGDIAGARQASDKANTWMWVSFWVGLVANILVVFLQFLPLLAGEY